MKKTLIIIEKNIIQNNMYIKGSIQIVTPKSPPDPKPHKKWGTKL